MASSGLKQPLLPPRPQTPGSSSVQKGPSKPVYQVPSAGDLAIRGKKAQLLTRSWLRIDVAGHSQLLEADKYAIMRRCSIPARDLRILDPLLVYPSTILGRERAIVINLEHIRAIIMAEEVLLVNPMDHLVLAYATELQRRLRERPPPQEMDVAPGVHRGRSASDSDVGSLVSQLTSVSEEPFEFKALEVALEAVCGRLSAQTKELEEESLPALDALTSKISTRNLERVRRLKSQLVALTVRVQKMRDEIEQLLDDDEDMAEMYLTEKKERMERMEAPDSPTSSHGPHHAPTAFGSAITTGMHLPPEEDESHMGPKSSRGRLSASSSSDTSETLDVDELEMLLEAYFVQIDGITNKLDALKNYIDDTEDYINLQLDNHRNQLLQLEILLTIATFVMAIFGVVAGIFGMNIPIELFQEDHSWAFKWVLIITGLGGCAVFVALLAWVKYNNLVT